MKQNIATHFHRKKVLALSALTASLFFITACGDETTTNVNETTGISSLASGEDLPECDSANVGEMLYVADSLKVYYCADDEWQTLNGKDGEDGSTGNAGESCEAVALKDSSGYKIICGEDSVGVILNGLDGENGLSGDSQSDTVFILSVDTLVVIDTVLGLSGASCTAEALEDSSGYKIICGDDSVGVVLNGSDGINGKTALARVSDGEYSCAEYDCVTTAYLNPAFEYGELLDERDGKVYRTIQVGDQIWMAQNLNYNDASDASLQGQTYCYYDSLDFCETYGRLYTWSAAMGFGSTYNTTAVIAEMIKDVHQGVCPSGWHLPSAAEWKELVDYVDANNGAEGVGTSLKARYLWRQDTTLKYQNISMGTDLFGWTGLPGDNYVGTEKVTINGKTYVGYDGNVGVFAQWWSSTEVSGTVATSRFLKYTNESLFDGQDRKTSAYSVRCLKNEN